MRIMKTSHIALAALSVVLPLCLVSCINDDYTDDGDTIESGTIAVAMRVRTLSSADDGYVVGTTWENYIDLPGGDYKMYFFTHNAAEEKDNTLIAEFDPADIITDEANGYSIYYVSGNVDEAITGYSAFKVVMLANLGAGNYPTNLEQGETTIDDLCNQTYSAFVDATTATALMPSSTLHIPFFGVRDYSGVTWTAGRRTNLSGDITLLRAVAKVEVRFSNTDADDDYVGLEGVTIHRYNATGYCAPTGVYTKDDYDHNGNWTDDFVSGLHLVGDANDEDALEGGKTIAFVKTQDRVLSTAGTIEQYETWTAYVPEYDNGYSTETGATATEDFSYITVERSGAEYEVYFAEYVDGDTDNTDPSNRWNIYRDNLYRFTVSMNRMTLTVGINILPWVERLDDYEF